MKTVGLSTVEVVALRTLTVSDRRQVSASYKAFYKPRQKGFIFVAGGIAFAWFAYHYYHHPGWLGGAVTVAAIAAVYLIGASFRIDGREQGYMEGYEDGLNAGVNRVLQISPDDDDFISETIMDERIGQFTETNRASREL